MLKLVINGAEMKEPAAAADQKATEEAPKAKARKPSNKAGKAANK